MVLASFIDVFSNPKIIISIVVALISVALTIFLAKKYKLTKYQILVFILLMLFWFSIIVARDYRKTFAAASLDVGGLGLGESMAATVAAAYGLISIFARLPFFVLSDFFRSRKFFIALSLVFTAVSSLLVVFNPSYINLLISSLAFGLGASLLAMFNVIFAETFSPSQAMVSVSILSISPLLGEFLVAPFQYYATIDTPRNYSFMWIMSAIMAIVCLIFLFFVKDNKTKTRNFTLAKFKSAITNYKFITICVVAIFISFIKFSTSGSNMTNFANILNMDPLLVAYLGVIFSVTQLFSGVLMGTVLTKKIGVKSTLILGIILSFIFSLVGSFVTNPVILFVSYAINGIGYGLTYNVLIGIAMQSFAKDMREVTMGIFQTFFAVGIYLGDKIYKVVIGLLKNNFTGIQLYQQTFLLTAIVCIITIIICLVVFNKKNKEFLDKDIRN